MLAGAVERAVERNGPKGDNVTVAIALPARRPNATPAIAPAASLLRAGANPNRLLLITTSVLFLLLAVVLLAWPGDRKEPKPTSTAVPAAASVPQAPPVPTPQPIAAPRAIPVETIPGVDAPSVLPKSKVHLKPFNATPGEIKIQDSAPGEKAKTPN
jgi:hypothetical protein